MLLSALIVIPLLGALSIAVFSRGENQHSADEARYIALFTTLVTFGVSLLAWTGFDANTADFQFVENHSWFESMRISYQLGIDGISLFMVLLTAFLMPLCILCSWRSITQRTRAFMINFLILESMVIGVFCALDAIVFYLFFEGMLIPMYLIIGVWGGKNRIYAAYKFFLYTLAGSVLFLVAIIYLYQQFGTTSIPQLIQQAHTLPVETQCWLWLAMLASFAVKVPMWPVHTWLPDAHVQAPTAGSVILAGILLKMGAYGFLRFSLPMLPDASHHYASLIFGLSIIAVIYTSLVALVQTDMKKLIAVAATMTMAISAFAANPEPAAEKDRLRIMGESKEFVVQTPSGPFTITRVMTACAKNAGWLQPLIPQKGVTPITEIEILEGMNDKNVMIIDMREPNDRIKRHHS